MSHHKFAWWLIVIGAINWGLIGLLDYNLVAVVFGSGTLLERLTYVLIGISGFWIAGKELSPSKKKY